MKKIKLLIILAIAASQINAQWPNTTNLFTDSTQIPVVNATGTQQYSMSINSYPDGGYIVFWEDERASSTNKKDIYAQKYDKNGNKLWGNNGKPVAIGANNQHFYSSMNADYRNYSYAATDSAGGFYMCYIDDSVATYTWQRICIQHLQSNGSKVFGKGYIIAQTPSNQTYNFALPQLIADGNDGFFLSYIIHYNGYDDLYAACYKDNNGQLKYYGGDYVNRGETNTSTCPNQLQSIPVTVSDYMMYPNLQNGCNIVMSLINSQDSHFQNYNKLVRVKKDVNITTSTGTIKYKKDDVMVFFTPIHHTVTVTCPGGAVGTAYLVDASGFAYTGNAGSNLLYSKGVTLQTGGNITVDVVAASEQQNMNNTNSPWYTQTAYIKSEVYSDVPYGFKHDPYRPENTFDGNPNQDSLTNIVNDTVFNNNSSGYYDFCMKSSGSLIYLAASIANGSSQNDILLQQLQVNKKTATSYAVEFTTGAANHNGVKTGNAVSTGFGTSDIAYNTPQIAVNTSGNALFYINEVSRATRVSPIINQTQLAWGAMGRRLGSGTFTNGYYNPDMPFITYSTLTSTALTSLNEQRNGAGNTGLDIYARNLNSLGAADYYPPYKPVLAILNSGGDALPEVLPGKSKHYSLIEFLNYNGSTGTYNDASPLAEILDKYNLGVVYVNVFQNTGAIRTYNGKPYLDRDYTINTAVSSSNPNNLRLFFTTADFNAIKAANSSIQDPSDLSIIKQASTARNAPSAYAPTTGDKKIAVQSWKAVTGGYYVEVVLNNFSSGYTNFYIFPAAVTLPLKANDAQFATSNNFSKTFIEKLYPSPLTGNSLYVKTGSAQVKQMVVEIFTADGKEVLKKQLDYQPQEIKLQNLAPGLYNVRISSDALLFTGKIVRQ